MLDLDKNLFEKLLILHLPSRCWLGKKRPALIFLLQLLLILCVQIFFHSFRHLEFDHRILLYSLILDFESWRESGDLERTSPKRQGRFKPSIIVRLHFCSVRYVSKVECRKKKPDKIFQHHLLLSFGDKKSK